jgi:hypothetical protein
MMKQARPQPKEAAAPRGHVRAAALILSALTLVLLWAGSASAAPGDVVWKDFSQRAPGALDAYTALAVTSAGEACVSGATAATPDAPSDVLVRKYGADGAAVWRRVWTWPGRTDDAASALVRDRRSDIVVAGSSGSCWLLLKYTGGGYLQWVRRSRGSFASAAFTAVAVDGPGDIYAAGTATPARGHSQFLLRKYSSSGALLWQKTLGSSAGDAAAVAVIVGDGDVYVTGSSQSESATSTVTTAKYSRTGVRRWVRTYAADGQAVRPSAIGYAAGPFVAGWGAAPGGAPHGFVARYDASGKLAWVAGYESAGVTGERFDAVSADAAGACVTGSRWLGGEQQMITLRFDALGALAWERARSQSTGGLAVCRLGGGFCSSGGGDGATAGVVTAAGAPFWDQSVSPAGYEDFRPVALAAAGSEYLYAAGSAAPTAGGTAAMLIRYRP